MTTAQMIPEKLLKVISCNCSRGCATKNCKNLGIICTSLCRHCEGKNCDNTENINSTYDEDSRQFMENLSETLNLVTEESCDDDDVTFAITEDNDDINSPPSKRITK